MDGVEGKCLDERMCGRNCIIGGRIFKMIFSIDKNNF
jgi:hypothetical protein